VVLYLIAAKPYMRKLAMFCLRSSSLLLMFSCWSQECFWCLLILGHT